MESKSRAAIVYWDSGGGVQHDAHIIEALLNEFGYSVRRIVTKDRQDKRERILKHAQQFLRRIQPLDIQIHLEQIHPEQFRLARKNFIFPNPEVTDPKVFPKLTRLERLCCKTRQAEALFQPISPLTTFTGFTSIDRRRDHFRKDFGKVLHLAGRSHLKGTEEILSAWRVHPEWPELTLVWTPDDAWGRPRRFIEGGRNIRAINNRLSEEDVLELMNTHGVHLCPSRTEGFGHYIVEALSTGAVVVTTDAPPMNELVSSETGYLVQADEKGKSYMNSLYVIREDSFAECMQQLFRESPEQLHKKSALARHWFLENRRQFKNRFREILLGTP